jgi:hypothetical protein
MRLGVEGRIARAVDQSSFCASLFWDLGIDLSTA